MINPFRTKEASARYDAYRKDGGLTHGCVLCKAEELEGFVHWKIIKNSFPYDRIARVHHMIVPRRHVKDHELTEEERKEFTLIKNDRLQTYQYMMETTHTTKSIPEHFHIHLIITKEIDCP